MEIQTMDINPSFWDFVQTLEKWIDDRYPEDIFECFGYELAKEAGDIVDPGPAFISRVRTAIRDLKKETGKEFDDSLPPSMPNCRCDVIPD